MYFTPKSSLYLTSNSVLSQFEIGQFAVNLENFAFVGASRAFCEMLGYPPDRIESKKLSQIDQTNSLGTRSEREKFVEFLQGAGRNYQQLVSYRHIDGSSRTCNVVYEFGGNANRRLLTGYVKIEHATQKSRWQSRFERVLKALPYGVVELDLEDNIVFADQKMGDLLGYEADTLCGRNITEFHISQADKTNSIRAIELRRKGLSGSYNRQFKKSNGSIIWMLVQAMPLFEGNEVTGVLGFHFELTNEDASAVQGLQSMSETLVDPVEHLRFGALIQGQENERIRIAKEIHDGLGQSLTAIIRKLNHTIRHEDNEQHKLKLEEIKDYVFDVLGEARAISKNLSPAVLEDFGVAEALYNVVENISDISDDGVSVTFQQKGLVGRRFEKNVEINFFRVAQEAISNAIQHSLCDTIDVNLEYENGNLSLRVSDNGVGTKTNSKLERSTSGLGFSNMRARANLITAKLEIDDTPYGVSLHLNKSLATKNDFSGK